MPNIKKVELQSVGIKGLRVRTKNVNEMNVETQKIAALWGRFHREIFPALQDDAMVYGVYHNYTSDMYGDFDVTVGADILEMTEEMQEVKLQDGRYLMFPVKGKLPQAIIETWQQIWAYFEDPSIDERRAYETDFEKYISEDEAEIYIGVHYF